MRILIESLAKDGDFGRFRLSIRFKFVEEAFELGDEDVEGVISLGKRKKGVFGLLNFVRIIENTSKLVQKGLRVKSIRFGGLNKL